MFWGDVKDIAQDVDKAIVLINKYASAPHNSRLAQYLAGEYYRIVKPDLPKAFEMYMKSAAQGFGKAMHSEELFILMVTVIYLKTRRK